MHGRTQTQKNKPFRKIKTENGEKGKNRCRDNVLQIFHINDVRVAWV